METGPPPEQQVVKSDTMRGRPEETMGENSVLHYIRSKDVRAHIKDTGLRFSDSEIGTLIFHSGLPYQELHRALKELAEQTADPELRRQIGERIAYDDRCRERFETNDGGFFFAVCVDGGGKEQAYSEAVGHFASVELALAFMEGKTVPFTVKKYQIVGVREPLVKSALRRNPRLFSGKLVQERPYEGAPVSEFSYDADGSLVRYWTDEISDEERSRVDDWGESRFENRFFPLPNPFELGDIVRMADDPDSLGIVETSRKDWAEWMGRVQKRKLPLDYYDSFIRVEFLMEQGTFIHSHIPPIDLERAALDETDRRKELLEAGSRMLTGQISLERFSCAYHAYQKELRGTKRKNEI